MRGFKVEGTVLIAAGVLGLAYTQLAPVTRVQTKLYEWTGMVVGDHQPMNLTVWVSVGAIVVGGFILMAHHRGLAMGKDR